MENNEVYTYLIGNSVAPHVAAAFVEETEMSSLNVTRYTLVHMSRNSMEDIEIWLQKADTKFNALKTAHKMTLTTAFHRLRHSLPDANPPASLTRKEPEDNDLVAPKLKKSKNKKSLKKRIDQEARLRFCCVCLHGDTNRWIVSITSGVYICFR